MGRRLQARRHPALRQGVQPFGVFGLEVGGRRDRVIPVLGLVAA